MDQSGRKRNVIFILGAGASKSAGLPLAKEIPSLMKNLSSDQDLDNNCRKLLRSVVDYIENLGLNTVDEMAANVCQTYDNKKIYFADFYKALWATCILLRHIQKDIVPQDLRSYFNLLRELIEITNDNRTAFLFDFNYDGIFSLAYEKFTNPLTSNLYDLTFFNGGKPWKLGNGEFHYYKLHGLIDWKIPLNSQNNSFQPTLLEYDRIENECVRITEYLDLNAENRENFIKGKMPSVPMIIFPSHLEILNQPRAKELLEHINKWVDDAKRHRENALAHAISAKAIGYSFPFADRREWWPIIEQLWKNNVPIQVQAGISDTSRVVENLRFEILQNFKDATQQKLERLIRSQPENF